MNGGRKERNTEAKKEEKRWRTVRYNGARKYVACWSRTVKIRVSRGIRPIGRREEIFPGPQESKEVRGKEGDVRKPRANDFTLGQSQFHSTDDECPEHRGSASGQARL